MYWSDQEEGGSWVIDSDTSESTGIVAFIEDRAIVPPAGARGEWIEDCSGNEEGAA